MHFCLLDSILERTDDRIVTLKHISMAEEYLQDHFPTFPVLPGVMMLEAMVQAARELLRHRPATSPTASPPTPPSETPAQAPARPFVLGKVRALKYGTFMPPGSTLRIEVTLLKALDDGTFDFRGEGKKLGSAPPDGEDLTAVSGRFTMRHIILPPRRNPIPALP